MLLLDEPTASLDLGYQLEVASLLHALNRERGVTMVLATHDLNLAASLCDTLVLMRDGRVLAQGPTANVLTAAHVRQLYDVDADVRFHERAGHLTVVAGTARAMTIARDAARRVGLQRRRRRPRPIRARLALTLAGVRRAGGR